MRAQDIESVTQKRQITSDNRHVGGDLVQRESLPREMYTRPVLVSGADQPLTVQRLRG